MGGPGRPGSHARLPSSASHSPRSASEGPRLDGKAEDDIKTTTRLDLGGVKGFNGRAQLLALIKDSRIASAADKYER